MSLTLSAPVFAIVAQLIEDAAGLHFRLADADSLAEKLSIRAAELELDSLLDYYYFLRYDARGPLELQALIDSLVVNETYFFREADQLEVLATLLVPRLLETRPVVRIWSSACSTGEEPVTLAMLLDDHGLLSRVELIASDISARALAKAERGAYGGRSLRALSPAQLGARFEPLPALEDRRPAESVRVPPRLRRCVTWKRVNLFDAAGVEALGTFDVVLCRNALIYFRDASVVRVLERFADSLRSGGYLLVGASESLLRFTTVLECEEHRGAFFYRKGGP